MKPVSAHHSLKQLMVLAQMQQQLAESVAQLLPISAREQLLGAAAEGNRLVLFSEQAAWASRIRFMERDILAHVQRNWPHLGISRHKILDAVGDLYLLGHPVLGEFRAHKSGHALNNQLLRALVADPEAWEMTTVADDQGPVSYGSSKIVI
jgi:hypothetical protein